jgi:hypothetical protein
MYADEQHLKTPSLYLEMALPSGGSVGTAVRLHQRCVTGSPLLSSSTDAQGTSVQRAYLVGEYEVLRINGSSVALRYRLKRVDGFSAMQDAQIRRVLDRLTWHTITVVLGQPLTMTVDGGSPLIGSITER